MSELKPCPSCLDDSSATRWAYIADNGATYSEKINYCPKCGRALTDKATRTQPANDPLTLIFGRGELGVGTAYEAENGLSREINIRRLSAPLSIASDTGDKGKYVDELENVLVRMQFENAESAHVLERAVRVVLGSFGQHENKPPEGSNP